MTCLNPSCQKAPKAGKKYCGSTCYRAATKKDRRCACGRTITRHSGTGKCAVCRDGTMTSAPSESLTVSGNTATVERTTTERVRSLPDLIRVCAIDTTEWDIVEWSAKASQQASVPRATRPDAGKKWTRPSTVPVLTQMFHVSAKLRRKSLEANTLQAIREGLIADIRAEAKQTPARTPRGRYVASDYLFEFPPFDLHMGKYTWAEETVTNYTSEHSEDLFNAALDYLLARALKLSDGKLSRVLCVFGNDAMHMDGKNGMTTAGTRMDVDTRLLKVFRRCCAVHRRAIDVLVQVAPVDVVIVPGNHDELMSAMLGEILATKYEDAKHVTVDNRAKLRKYYAFGTNLLGFTHGDKERVNELPLAMAREVPDLWARCEAREIHVGHKHIAEKFEASSRPGRIEQDYHSDKGVRVRRLASMSAHDAWHTEHAYMDRRACDAFLFHRTAGFSEHLSFNVDHFTGKAVSK